MENVEGYPSSLATSSARSRKRQRQRNNQHRRALVHDVLVTLHEHPTFENVLRVWVEDISSSRSAQEYRSASKFAHALRSLMAKTTGQHDFSEIQELSVDGLVQWVEDLAWSLNIELTVMEEAGRLKTSTGRVAANFRSLVHFLDRQIIINQRDTMFLLDACQSLEDDLLRTAKINRIMEEYASFVQETYFDTNYAVDQNYWGEYEVYKVSRRRLLRLRKFNDAEGDTTVASDTTILSVRFPAPLVDMVKIGDILTMQLCHLERDGVWVPFMYSGFTPTREDGEETPREPRTQASTAGQRTVDPIAAIQRRLSVVELSPARVQRRTEEGPDNPDDCDGLANDGFDEAQFTDEYFQSWEGDIDSDEDGNAMHANETTGMGGNLQTALRRHHN